MIVAAVDGVAGHGADEGPGAAGPSGVSASVGAAAPAGEASERDNRRPVGGKRSKGFIEHERVYAAWRHHASL